MIRKNNFFLFLFIIFYLGIFFACTPEGDGSLVINNNENEEELFTFVYIVGLREKEFEGSRIYPELSDFEQYGAYELKYLGICDPANPQFQHIPQSILEVWVSYGMQALLFVRGKSYEEIKELLIADPNIIVVGDDPVGSF